MANEKNYWEGWMRQRMSRRAMLRRAGLTGLVLAGGSSLWACGQTETPKASGPGSSGPTPSSEKPKRGGTLKIGTESNFNILDPHTFVYSSDEVYLKHIFNYLVDYDAKLAYTPGLSLSESWVMKDDVTIEFKLRKGVKFSDGTEWNAENLKYNLQRILDPATRSPRAYSLDPVKDVQYPDNFTAKFTLKQPMASFFGDLSHPGVGMVSPANVAKYKNIADLQRNPLGTGPYMMTEVVPDDHYTLVGYKDYWRKGANGDQLPYVDTVRFQIIPDGTVRHGGLKTGQIDVNIGTDPKDVAEIKASSDLEAYIFSGGYLSGMFWNLSRPPFNNLNFRKAFSYGINREGITKAMTFGLGQPFNGVVMPSAAWAYDPKRPVTPLDPVKAKQYLDKAIAEGVKPEFTQYPMNATFMKISEMMQADLAKIGIKMNLVMDNTAPNRYWTSFEIDAFYAGYSLGIDPFTKMYIAHHSKGMYTPERKTMGANWDTPEGHYAKMDKAIEAVNLTYDPEKRKKLLHEAADIVDESVAFIGIYHQPYVMSASKKVQGLHFGGDGKARFDEAWLKV